MNPGALELCNDRDDDCDGTVDVVTRYTDEDGDGHAGTPTAVHCDDLEDRHASEQPDCDDTNAAIHPDTAEVCGDGVDNDCDGELTCLQETLTLPDGSTYANAVWLPDGRPYGDRPEEGQYAFVWVEWRCIADDTVELSCTDGERVNRELEWIDGHLAEGDGITSTWTGSVYQYTSQQPYEHEGVLYDYRFVLDFHADVVEVGGGEEGRPFTVGRKHRVAATSTAPGWCDAVDDVTDAGAAVRAHWLRAARAEHASVASFARFALELMALGAPSDLVDEAAVAMRDEVRHARLCFGVAAAAGATEVGVGPLDMTGALPDISPESVLQGLILEGCVNETISAALAERALATAAEPSVRAALEEIVADETRHAAYAWRCARWLLGQHPGLRELAERTFRFALATQGSGVRDRATDATPAWGLLGADDQLRAHSDAWRAVIEPATAALLAGARGARGLTAQL